MKEFEKWTNEVANWIYLHTFFLNLVEENHTLLDACEVNKE